MAIKLFASIRHLFIDIIDGFIEAADLINNDLEFELITGFDIKSQNFIGALLGTKDFALGNDTIGIKDIVDFIL